MGRILLLALTLLSINNLLSQPNMILVKDINRGPNSVFNSTNKLVFLANDGVSGIPNPSTDFIMISMNANLNPATVRILDPGGRLVFKRELIINTPAKIPLTDLRSRWYLLEVQSDGEIQSKKFLKQ